MILTLTSEQKSSVVEMIAEMKPGFSGYSVAREFNSRNVTGKFAPRYDWHEFANLLDELNSKKVVRVTGFGRDGETLYELVK